MKLVTAIIQPFMMDRLARALRKNNVSGYTASDVMGSGRDLANTGDYLQPRVKVEVAVLDEQVSSLIDLIVQTVRTHQDGDGIILVTPLLQVVNIQTGLTGENALTVTGNSKQTRS